MVPHQKVLDRQSDKPLLFYVRPMNVDVVDLVVVEEEVQDEVVLEDQEEDHPACPLVHLFLLPFHHLPQTSFLPQTVEEALRLPN